MNQGKFKTAHTLDVRYIALRSTFDDVDHCSPLVIHLIAKKSVCAVLDSPQFRHLILHYYVCVALVAAPAKKGSIIINQLSSRKPFNDKQMKRQCNYRFICLSLTVFLKDSWSMMIDPLLAGAATSTTRT